MGNSDGKLICGHNKDKQYERIISHFREGAEEIKRKLILIREQSEEDRVLAKMLLNKGEEEKAKIILRKRIYQEKLLDKTEKELEAFEKVIENPESLELRKQALEGLKEGRDAVKKLTKLRHSESFDDFLRDARLSIEFENGKPSSTSVGTKYVADRMEDATEKAIDGLASAKYTIVDSLKEAKDTLAPRYEAAKDVIACESKDHCPCHCHEIQSVPEEAMEKALGFSTIADKLKGADDAVASGFAAGIGHTKGAVASASGLGSTKYKIASDFEKTHKTQVSGVLDYPKIHEVIDEVLEAAKEMISEKVDDTKVASEWKATKDTFPSGPEDDKNKRDEASGFSTIVDKLKGAKDAVASGLEAAKDTIAAGFEAVTDKTASFIDHPTEKIASGIEVTKEVVSSGVEVAKETIAEKYDDAKDALASGLEMIKDKITAGINNTKEPVASASKQVTDEIASGVQYTECAIGFENSVEMFASSFESFRETFEDSADKEEGVFSAIANSLTPEDEAYVKEEIKELTKDLESEGLIRLPISNSTLDRIHTNFR